MRKVRIKRNEGWLGSKTDIGIDAAGLQVGDTIEVSSFVSNSVIYEDKKTNMIHFIYEWNLEDVE